MHVAPPIPLKVIQHGRRQLASHFSIERLFGEIRAHFPPGYEVELHPCPQASQGLLPRVRNVAAAARQQADVHHIVGDVHYLAFGLPAARTILTIHNCAALNRLKGLARAALKYFWFSGPIKRAAVTTTISKSTRQELRAWLGPRADGVEIVPNCVSSDFTFKPKAFQEASPVCLQVGTKWNKNLERVAEALRGTQCRLEVVGTMDAEQRSLLAATRVPFRALGRVSDDELVEAYRRCDFVTFVSLYEGFGLPILEAQATGRPVITSNIGPMPEAAGEGALLVDPTSVEAIRAAVTSLVESHALRESLVEKGRSNASNFQPAQIARRYADLYDRVARKVDRR